MRNLIIHIAIRTGRRSRVASRVASRVGRQRTGWISRHVVKGMVGGFVGVSRIVVAIVLTMTVRWNFTRSRSLMVARANDLRASEDYSGGADWNSARWSDRSNDKTLIRDVASIMMRILQWTKWDILSSRRSSGSTNYSLIRIVESMAAKILHRICIIKVVGTRADGRIAKKNVLR